MNSITIIARISTKPEHKTVDGGRLLSRFGVEITSGREQDRTTAMTVYAWDDEARRTRSLEKDDLCLLACRTRVRQYNDVDGNRRRSLDLVAREVHPITRDSTMSTRQRAEYLGHLTADPLREGKRVRFSVAVDEPGEPENTQYVDCVAFEPLAKTAEENLRKGMQVVVEGRYEIETYETREGGTADSIRLLLDQHGLTIGWTKRDAVVSTAPAASTITTPPAPTSRREADDTSEDTTEDEPEWVRSSNGAPQTSSETSRTAAAKTPEPQRPAQVATKNETVVIEKKVYNKDVPVDFLSPDAELPF